MARMLEENNITNQVYHGWQSEPGCSILRDRSVLEFQTTESVAQLLTQWEPGTFGSQSSSVCVPTSRQLQQIHQDTSTKLLKQLYGMSRLTAWCSG